MKVELLNSLVFSLFVYIILVYLLLNLGCFMTVISLFSSYGPKMFQKFSVKFPQSAFGW